MKISSRQREFLLELLVQLGDWPGVILERKSVEVIAFYWAWGALTNSRAAK
jgi:hypothetical protein